MAIDLIKDFSKHEKAILQYVRDRQESYFNSDTYKRLRYRYHTLRDAIDGKTSVGANRNYNQNLWFSKLTFPLVRQAFLLRRSATKANFRNDPIITVEPNGATSFENAINMQDVLNQNLKSTRFRPIVFNELINTASTVGVAVTYSTWASDTKKYRKTAADPNLGYARQEINKPKKNVKNHFLHPLNYFQNHNVNEPTDSDFQGHIQRWPLDQLIAEYRKDQSSYIKENLSKVIKEAIEGIVKNSNYYKAGQSGVQDPNSHSVDLSHWCGTLNIKGNEEDSQNYYIEWAGDHLVRLQDNPHDEDIRPYSIFRYDIRPDHWWGNIDIESQLPLEIYMNMIIGMKADNAIRNLEQFIFYDKGTLDIADINRRHKSGGWIGLNLKTNQNLQNLLFPYQGRDVSGQDIQFITEEVKEISQRMSSAVDLQRQPSEGGLQNKTATAAMMIQEQGNQLEYDYFEQFSNGLVKMGEVNCVMLQQYLSDNFAIRPDIKEQQRVLEKSDILGSYSYNVSSSMTKNKVGEAMRLQNVITAMLNFTGTGNPVFQNIDMTKVVREWLKKMDLPGDIDEIYPEQSAMQAPGAVPSLQMPGAQIPGAVQGLPAPMAQPQIPNQMGAGV